jgi:acetoin utilization deacetylase AcuC-like enzyme
MLVVLHIVHHPQYVIAAATPSRFPHDKYGLVMEALVESGRTMTVHRPEMMPRAWLEAIHDPVYVDEIVSGTLGIEREKRIGFPVTPAVALRSQLSPGGTWLAAKLALKHGFAANSAGGSHHALANTGAGYCVFNDLAIASNRLLVEGDAKRILILDLDVHQGDGTAALTAGRPDIFTFSIHAEKNYPSRKARSSLDIALPDETGDAAYLDALSSALPRVMTAFAPDLILLQAGVDGHCEDRLGRLSLSDDGLAARDRYVAQIARDQGIAIASTLGGGYGADTKAVAQRHARTIFTLARARLGTWD